GNRLVPDLQLRRIRQTLPRQDAVRIEGQRLPGSAHRPLQKRLLTRLVQIEGVGPGSQRDLVGAHILRSPTQRAGLLRGGDRWRERRDDRAGPLLRGPEDIFEHPAIAFGPDMRAGLRLDQLGGYADSVAGAPDAALQHIANAELAPHLLDVDRPALV